MRKARGGSKVNELISVTELSLCHSYQSKLSKTGLNGPIMSAHAQYRVCTCSVKGKHGCIVHKTIIYRVKVVQQQKMHNL